jgi:hypothetical protein
MSHYRLKTTYNEMGAYGSLDKKTIYAHHNLSCDIVSFYDEKGNHILSVEDTMDNNILDAINKLYAPWKESQQLMKGIEYMEPEEFKLIGH